MIKKIISFSILAFLLTGTGIIAVAQNRPVSLTSFRHGDIGNPSIAGTVNNVKNGFDIYASGADIWGTKDEFNFVYMERTGDFDLAAQIENMRAADLYSKAGLMARENLTASCRHLYFLAFSDNNPRHNNNGGYEFQYRMRNGDESQAFYPKTYEGRPLFPISYPNAWIRLRRVNNNFTGFCSSDGKTWKEYTTFTLALPSKIYLGIAVTSHNAGHSASAKFRNIEELTH
jgi:hypothetical protein